VADEAEVVVGVVDVKVEHELSTWIDPPDHHDGLSSPDLYSCTTSVLSVARDQDGDFGGVVLRIPSVQRPIAGVWAIQSAYTCGSGYDDLQARVLQLERATPPPSRPPTVADTTTAVSTNF
jgi:hypothetical protein